MLTFKIIFYFSFRCPTDRLVLLFEMCYNRIALFSAQKLPLAAIF